METGPIFIAGADRSGTTLTYAILVSSPHIAITHPSPDLWTFFYGQYGDLAQPQNFERCLAQILKYKPIYNLQPDPERIRREFAAGEPSYARLFALFQEHYAQSVGRLRWGDKTSYIERYADPIFAAYPEAKMIHLIRDPRDRYASAIKRWPNSKGQVGGATARWLYSVRLAQRNLANYPDRYKIVRFETLVTRPEETVRAICDFLGELFDPAMLMLEGAERFANRGGNSSFSSQQAQVVQSSQGKITPGALGRYHQLLSKREIAFIQHQAQAEMKAFDYAVEPLDLGLNDRLVYYLTAWPNNFGRMTAWRTVEGIQHNFPAWFGRKPNARTQLQD